jgi:transposase InsO family protein
MKIRNGLIPGVTRLAKHTADISKEAQRRVKWFDYYAANGHNARKTCRHFDISPDTFYRWKKLYDPQNLKTLEDCSHRPKHVRQHTWTPCIEQKVLELRERYPRWGKAKLMVLLKEEGFELSVSMVGRILKCLKERGILIEPIPNHISARKRQRKRPYAIRKPREYVATLPGDIVQVDTLDVRPLPGLIFKQFTARDVISRWDVIKPCRHASSRAAARFIDTIIERMPFEVKALQIDGGSEFEGTFEEVCKNYGIELFVLPPRSPKLNGHVERANRTHTEEFYEVTDISFEMDELNEALLKWEYIYNTVRPHQSLGYLTPKKYLEENFSKMIRRNVSAIN